ncbi:hypothetical protein Tdes44962_MAKER05243 [Teratosphaeria destructans]|uniref:Uncharacterized protein n=1 Tax=Teratosphaeria destructans TaxID=418781 RepID=A0A9W7SKJ4_9PEZI|nr:hypothetical protein Tdes44962_MAKER05243 [Teratosphaeria destructans]
MSGTDIEPFALAKTISNWHLIVQPSDLAYNPPESYLFVQDGLIIACGVLYALCYLFYMIRTVKDNCGTMAYELYYAFTVTSTTFELACFLIWFVMDLTFAAIAIFAAYPPNERAPTARRMIAGVLIGLATFHGLCKMYPDEREQLTAYWTGILLQLPIGWGELILLFHRGDTKGQSLEIWITRYLGCYTAYAVFYWRYWNLPQNWTYVGSIWSPVIIIATLIPETIYPFVYYRVHQQQQSKLKGS